MLQYHPNRRKFLQQASLLGTSSLFGLPTWAYHQSLTLSDSEVLEKAKTNIPKIRMADVRLFVLDKNGSPLPTTSFRIEQKQHAFLFGENHNVNIADSPEELLKEEKYLSSIFNAITAMCYWTESERHIGLTKFETYQGNIQDKSFDDTVHWARARGFQVKGHPLFWSVPKAVPDWLLRYPYETQLKFLEVRVRNLVSRYKDKVMAWDVVNEMLWEPSLRNIKQRSWPFTETTEEIMDYISPIIRWAREENPAATLLLNEYGVEQDFSAEPLRDQNGEIVNFSKQRKRFIELIRRLGDKHTAPDVMGLQAHMGAWQKPAAQWEFYEEMKTAGLPLHITEFWAHTSELRKQGKALTPENGEFVMKDIQASDNLPTYTEAEIETLQAQYVRDYLTVAFGHPAIEAFFFWGFSNFAFDRKENAIVRPRLTYQYVHDLVRKQWKTDENKATDKDGQIAFRGFYGEYQLSYTTGNTVKAVPFTIHKTMHKTGQPITLYLRLNV